MTSIPVPEAPPDEPSGTKIGPVVIAFALGTAVSIGLGVYGRLHTPSGHGVNISGFSSGAAAKAALASVVLALAILQAVTAMGLYGRIRCGAPGLGPCTAGRGAWRSLSRYLSQCSACTPWASRPTTGG